MEVVEIITFSVNKITNVLEVSFKCFNDTDDEIREDKIFLNEVKDFGFDFINNLDDDDFLSEEMYDDEDDDIIDDDLYISYDEILEFLNEYYVVYPDKLPKAELY